MFIDNVTIWVCGDYIMSRFENCIDAGFYMSNDRINHLTIEFDLGQPPNLLAILGCQDNCVRVVNGDYFPVVCLLFTEKCRPGCTI